MRAAPRFAIDAPVIERAAGDGAFELRRVGLRVSRSMSAIEARPPEAITGIDDGIGERDRRLPVDAGEHAVAVDVGVDDRRDAGVLEARARGRSPSCRTSPPSPRPRPCRRARRCRRRSGPGCAARRLADELGIAQRGGAEDDARDALRRARRRSRRGRGCRRRAAPSCRRRRTRGWRRPPRRCAAAGEGAVEVDDMQPGEADLHEGARLRRRDRRCRRSRCSISPLTRRTHSPSFRSMAGKRIMRRRCLLPREKVAASSRMSRRKLSDSAAALTRRLGDTLSRMGEGSALTAATSGNSRSAPGRAPGSSPDGTACRRNCRARRSPSPARHSRRARRDRPSSRGARWKECTK